MKKGLVKSIVAAVFAVLSFVGLAFNFLVVFTTFGNHTESRGYGIKTWLDVFDSGLEKTGLWKLAEVLMIVLFIVLVAAVALAFVRVWVDSKVIYVLLKVCSIVALLLSIAFIVAMIAGGFVFSSQFSSGTYSLTYFPNVGPFIIAIAGIVSSSLLIPKGQKKA